MVEMSAIIDIIPHNIYAAMHFVSTRGGTHGVSFMQALMSGLTPNGGMYIPKTIPRLEKVEWREMANLDYEELSKKIFRMFVSKEEIPDEDYDGKQQ